MMTGNPILPANSRPSFRLFTSADFGTSRPIFCIASLKKRRSSAFLMASTLAPIRCTLYFSSMPPSESSIGKIQRGLSADGRQNGESGAGRHLALDADDLFQIFARERLDVSAVGDLRIGHDGGRVRVHQHHFVALGLERLAGLRAGVIELADWPMTMGPEPMIRIFEMSVRLGIV